MLLIKKIFNCFRSFLCELGFYVKELGRSKIFTLYGFYYLINLNWKKNTSLWKKLNIFIFSAISAREHGSNKQMASKSCALSLVRQLYHLQVIEAYTGVTKKKDTDKVLSIF